MRWTTGHEENEEILENLRRENIISGEANGAPDPIERLEKKSQLIEKTFLKKDGDRKTERGVGEISSRGEERDSPYYDVFSLPIEPTGLKHVITKK